MIEIEVEKEIQIGDSFTEMRERTRKREQGKKERLSEKDTVFYRVKYALFSLKMLLKYCLRIMFGR